MTLFWWELRRPLGGCASIENPVAFVAENEDGTRFWSHGGAGWVKDMREQMQSIYDDYMKGR